MLGHAMPIFSPVNISQLSHLGSSTVAEQLLKVATMELTALMTVVVSICDHRSSRYYSEAWQSEHHRASCEYSNPICGAWGNQSTTWDNPTKVSLMALHDSGEFCLTVLFDAVASLSNSYLDMDFMGQV